MASVGMDVTKPIDDLCAGVVDYNTGDFRRGERQGRALSRTNGQ